MATVDNSPQYKELTTSNEGRNVRASLQAVSHFFLEDNSFSQTETDSFGAKSTSKFATTAKVTFSGTKKVYALCQGQIFVQPQTGSTDKVNVILKPYKQPINSIPIKYIVYRGLNKSDFFTAIQHEGNSRLQIAGSQTSGSGFVQYIWAEFNKFYSNVSGTIPPFLEEFIGFPASANSQNINDLIDHYFYHISQYDENTGEEIESTAFELPLIPRGTHLGNATGSIGIDIVMNNGDYYVENDPTPFQFNLAFGRSAYHELETGVGNTNYENKLLKEIATQFMDIVALYGMHASGNGKLYVDTQSTPITTTADLYNIITPFFTKSTVYLYIQSNRQRSYNFYGNYVLSDTNSNNMKIGASATALTETSFGTHDWPVHKINSTTANIALALVTDNYENAAAYAKIGFVVSEHEDSFIRGENLLIPKILNDEENDLSIQFTKPITFSFPVSGQNTIASVVQLIYEGLEIWVENTQNNESYYVKDIDDVFGLIDAQSITATRSELELPTVTRDTVQIINFPNPQRNTDIGMIKTKKVSDAILINDQENLERVTYETLLDSISQENSSSIQSQSSTYDSSVTSSINFNTVGSANFYQPEPPYNLKIVEFTDNNNPVKGLQLISNNQNYSSKKILGVTKSENQLLVDLVTVENLSNSTIFFLNQNGTENDYYISPESIKYRIYHIGIIGEKNDTISNIYMPLDPVIVYTLDDFIFISRAYAEYIQKNEDSEFKTLKFNI